MTYKAECGFITGYIDCSTHFAIGTFKDIPSMLGYDLDIDIESLGLPPLVAACRKLQLKALQDLQACEKVVLSAKDTQYNGVEDESGWSEDDHNLYTGAMLLVQASCKAAQNHWNTYKRFQRREQSIRAKLNTR